MQTTLTTSNNFNTLLVAPESDQGEPQTIYRNLTHILKEAPISQPNYWENHGLVFEEGQIHLVNHHGDDATIYKLVREALLAPTLSFQEKAELAIYAKGLFVAHDLPLEETSMKFSIIDESNGDSIEISLPLSQCSKSFLLTQFWTGNYSEALQAQHQEAVPIVLPVGTTHEDFLNYVNFDTLEDLTPDQLSAVLFLSSYFNDVTTGNSCLDCFPFLLPDSRTALEDLLLQTPLFGKELGNRYASIIMNQYIRLRLKEGASIQEIVQTIQRIPQLKMIMQSTSFDLNLQGLISSPEELILLASAIARVHSLNLTSSELDQLPLVWGDTLQRLDISETENITTIPAGFAHLEEFTANDSRNLQDISGLNGSSVLKKINISGTLVSLAPSGCSSLQIFEAYNAKRLNDISGLNGSSALQELYIGRTLVSAAPYDCLALQVFNADSAERFSDISGLSGSTALQKLNISRTLINSIPYNWASLQIFNANNAQQLIDVSGLNHSLALTEINIGGTLVNCAPIGCRSLQIFNAYNAKHLNDISGLNGSPVLQQIDIGRTSVSSAPHSCKALEIFDANDNQLLTDISGLDGSPKLREIHIAYTSVTSAPNQCQALRLFDAEHAKQLRDIFGLSGSPNLIIIDVSQTLVSWAPHSCKALEIFDASYAKNLYDISGLSGSPSLEKIDIQGTAVTSIPEDVHALRIFK